MRIETENAIYEQIHLLIAWNESNLNSNVEQVRLNLETIANLLSKLCFIRIR